MGVVTLTKRTQSLVDELLSEWQQMTKTEDAAALIARSIVDSLLDLRAFSAEFDQTDASKRVGV